MSTQDITPAAGRLARFLAAAPSGATASPPMFLEIAVELAATVREYREQITGPEKDSAKLDALDMAGVGNREGYGQYTGPDKEWMG